MGNATVTGPPGGQWRPPRRTGGATGGTQGPPGPTGPQGPAGATGATGPAGPGVAAGGTTGQVLTKASATDYATTWATPAPGLAVVGASAPASPAVGQLWWRTTDGNLYVYYNDGSSSQWVPASGRGTVPGGPTAVVSDNFESYPLTQIGAPWTNVNNTSVTTTQPHASAQSLQVGSNGNASSATLPLGSSLSKWILDVWLYVNATGGTTGQYIGLENAAAAGNGIVLNIGASGAGQVYAPPSGTVFCTFSTTTGAWHHCVLTVSQAAAAGSIALTIDGTSVGTFSGDTRDVAGLTAVTQVRVVGVTIGPVPPAEFWVDDLLVSNNA